MTEAASLPELRNQLEIAQQLAKSRIAFVVVPVATRAGFEKLCQHQAARLLAIADEAEKAQPRQTVNDTLTILRRLADGDTIVYSQDGDLGWFTKGDRAFIGDEIMTLRACGYIKREIDPTDETDNYRGMAEYDTITDAGRKYLKEQSR